MATDYSKILANLNAKLQRQRENVSETEQHIAAIKELEKRK